MAGLFLRVFDGLRQSTFPFHPCQCLLIPQGFEGFGGSWVSAREDGADLIGQAVLEHGLGTGIEDFVELMARRIEADEKGLESFQR